MALAVHGQADRMSAFLEAGALCFRSSLAGKATQATDLRVFIQKGNSDNYEYFHGARIG